MASTSTSTWQVHLHPSTSLRDFYSSLAGFTFLIRALTSYRLMGDVSARIKDVKPAKEIIHDLVYGAKEAIEQGQKLVRANAKL